VHQFGVVGHEHFPRAHHERERKYPVADYPDPAGPIFHAGKSEYEENDRDRGCYTSVTYPDVRAACSLRSLMASHFRDFEVTGIGNAQDSVPLGFAYPLRILPLARMWGSERRAGTGECTWPILMAMKSL